MLKYFDIFDLLSENEEQSVAAVYMTYGFDAQLFETYILPAFLGIHSGADDFDLQAQTKNAMYFRNQVALKLREVPVAVYSDGSQYVGGRSFLYDHIAIQGKTFHPKCYLLLFKSNLRVIITSANLTISGFCYNAEVLWHEDIYLDKASPIARDLFGILREIAGIGTEPVPVALNEILKYLSKISDKSDYPKIVSTCTVESPFKQFLTAIKDYNRPPKEITILSPFYENDREKEFEQSMAISFLSHFSSSIRVNLCFPAAIQNDKWVVRAPKNLFEELFKKYPNSRFKVVPASWEQEDGEPVPRTLHGKIVCVRFSDNTYLYMGGSINFTERAMRSRKDKLRNVEIGILELTKKPFVLPKCIPVNLDELEVHEESSPDPKPVCFVQSAILEHSVLTIKIDLKKASYPFTILYGNKQLITVVKPIEELLFKNFKLARCQDLEISAGNGTFFVPIMVMNKAEVVTEDLEWDSTIGFSDVIDYLAGKYRSISELQKNITCRKPNPGNSLSTLFFRQNLQRYFKAMDALKQGLEQPFNSEYAFQNYLSSPVGLTKLTEMILDDYNSKTAGKQESFLFISELLNVLLHLEFMEDWVDPKFKRNELQKIIDKLYSSIKAIIKGAKGTIRQQYKIICYAYGIEVK
ncbi:MAG: hypothetical protein ABFD18_06080 [Syntrophomonas sp.]